jgi:8-oxo-dGTP diphosphatase
MDETIHFTADVVAIDPAGRVLLVERGDEPHKGALALPGGRVNRGETSRQAAARELFEETGIRVDPASLRQLGAWDAPDRDPRGRYVTVAYVAELPEPVEPTAGDDAAAARWWPINGLPHNLLAFDHAEILHAAL